MRLVDCTVIKIKHRRNNHDQVFGTSIYATAGGGALTTHNTSQRLTRLRAYSEGRSLKVTVRGIKGTKVYQHAGDEAYWPRTFPYLQLLCFSCVSAPDRVKRRKPSLPFGLRFAGMAGMIAAAEVTQEKSRTGQRACS